MALSDTFTVGRDCEAVLVWWGRTITLPGLTQIKTTPKYKSVTSAPLNSPELTRELPGPHEVSIMFDRTDDQIEQTQSDVEDAWWDTGSSSGSTDPDGGLFLYFSAPFKKTWNYQQVGWKVTDSGSMTVDGVVKGELIGTAARRKVS